MRDKIEGCIFSIFIFGSPWVLFCVLNELPTWVSVTGVVICGLLFKVSINKKNKTGDKDAT